MQFSVYWSYNLWKAAGKDFLPLLGAAIISLGRQCPLPQRNSLILRHLTCQFLQLLPVLLGFYSESLAGTCSVFPFSSFMLWMKTFNFELISRVSAVDLILFFCRCVSSITWWRGNLIFFLFYICLIFLCIQIARFLI